MSTNRRRVYTFYRTTPMCHCILCNTSHQAKPWDGLISRCCCLPLQGVWMALKQYEFIWFSGPGRKSKMRPVNYLMFSMNSYVSWTALKHYEPLWFLGLGNISKMDPVSYQPSLWIYMISERPWSNMNLCGCRGPGINQRRVLWAIRHLII